MKLNINKKIVKNAVLVIIAAGLIFYIATAGIDTLNLKKSIDSTVHIDDTIINMTDDQLTNEQSDISGMTKKDKVEKNLLPQDDADSDGDGLSDKDEIEVYHTDPLKASTSGDMYTDGWKVAHGMDVNKEEVLDCNLSDIAKTSDDKNVVLVPMSADSRNAVLYDATDMPYVKEHLKDGWGKAYSVSGFTGAFCINAENISENNKEPSVMIQEGYNKPEKTELIHSDDGGQWYIPDYDFSVNESYTVYVMKGSGGYKDADVPLFNAIAEKASDIKLTDNKFKALAAYNGQNVFFKSHWQKPEFYYVSTGDKDIDNAFLTRFLHDINLAFLDSPESYTPADFTAISADEYHEKCLKLAKEHPFTRKYPTEDEMALTKKNQKVSDIPMLLFTFGHYRWFTFSDGPASDDIEQAVQQYTEGSDLTDEVFTFPNFSTFRTSGVCAGIADYIMTLRNTGSFPSSGSYKVTPYLTSPLSSEERKNREEESWDLSTDKDNKTLTDRGLSDFKNKDFVKNHTEIYNLYESSSDSEPTKRNVLSSNLTEGETEFVKMIECKWQESNDNTADAKYMRSVRQAYYNYDLIKLMTKKIDEGKVIAIGAYLYTPGKNKNITTPAGAHTVIAYQYKKQDNGDIVFYIYDPNFPESASVSSGYEMTVHKIHVTNMDAFIYYYKPAGTDQYVITNWLDPYRIFEFIVYDENYNILNDQCDDHLETEQNNTDVYTFHDGKNDDSLLTYTDADITLLSSLNYYGSLQKNHFSDRYVNIKDIQKLNGMENAS